MRKLSVFFLALMMAVMAVGCDSNDNDESDAELFVGTWTMVAFTDGDGDRMPLFNQIANELTATLNADMTYSLFVDYKPASGNQPLTIPGSYTVTEGASSLTLSTPTGQNIPFTYSFDGDSRVSLETDAAFVNGLFQTTVYTGRVTITIEK